jgi:hypothetical protein
MSWRLTGDGQAVQTEADASAWAWEIVNEDGSERRKAIVEISGTAMSASSVPFRVDHARQSNGQTEIERVLEWREPPRKIVLRSESTVPDMDGGDPGPDVAEIIEITDWFDERGITLVFTGRGSGALGAAPLGGAPLGALITSHTANPIDLEADDLVERFEAESRLAAARDARQWWIENRGPGKPITIELAPAHETSSAATLEISVPKISAEQQAELDRREIHLVLNGPSPDGPDSGYVFEAYDKDLKMIGLSVGEAADDAYLALFDDLFRE